jgi:hypothetical protein
MTEAYLFRGTEAYVLRNKTDFSFPCLWAAHIKKLLNDGWK